MTDNGVTLGTDVTATFKATHRRNTAMLSLRIDAKLLAELERRAIAEDRSLSWIARQAIRRGLSGNGTAETA